MLLELKIILTSHYNVYRSHEMRLAETLYSDLRLADKLDKVSRIVILSSSWTAKVLNLYLGFLFWLEIF